VRACQAGLQRAARARRAPRERGYVGASPDHTYDVEEAGTRATAHPRHGVAILRIAPSRSRGGRASHFRKLLGLALKPTDPATLIGPGPAQADSVNDHTVGIP
jgi:hypothetical protein